MRLAREYPLNTARTAKQQITIFECGTKSIPDSSGAVRRTQRPHDVEVCPLHRLSTPHRYSRAGRRTGNLMQMTFANHCASAHDVCRQRMLRALLLRVPSPALNKQRRTRRCLPSQPVAISKTSSAEFADFTTAISLLRHHCCSAWHSLPPSCCTV